MVSCLMVVCLLSKRNWSDAIRRWFAQVKVIVKLLRVNKSGYSFQVCQSWFYFWQILYIESSVKLYDLVLARIYGMSRSSIYILLSQWYFDIILVHVSALCITISFSGCMLCSIIGELICPPEIRGIIDGPYRLMLSNKIFEMLLFILSTRIVPGVICWIKSESWHRINFVRIFHLSLEIASGLIIYKS